MKFLKAGLPETIILKDDETYWPPTPIVGGGSRVTTNGPGPAARNMNTYFWRKYRDISKPECRKRA